MLFKHYNFLVFSNKVSEILKACCINITFYKYKLELIVLKENYNEFSVNACNNDYNESTDILKTRNFYYEIIAFPQSQIVTVNKKLLAVFLNK